MEQKIGNMSSKKCRRLVSRYPKELFDLVVGTVESDDRFLAR